MATKVLRNHRGEMLETITVAELIEQLQGQDPDGLVIFSTDYGDYCHTKQALPIRGEIEEYAIQTSGYSNSGFALVEKESDDEEEAEEEAQKFLVIR